MEDSAYVTMNGVRRFVSTCDSPSLYHYAFEHENITVSKHTIEREVRRVIEESMAHGGGIAELAMSCMTALDADSLAEQRARAVEFHFETTVTNEKWGVTNTKTPLEEWCKKSLTMQEWAATQELANQLAKTSLTLQDTYDDLRGSEEKTNTVAEKMELMESLMRGSSDDVIR